MPFNAETYRMNQYRKKAWVELAQAKDIRDRARTGDAYDWEIPRIATFVKLARISMRLHLGMRRARVIG
jgi:hypothetical protein